VNVIATKVSKSACESCALMSSPDHLRTLSATSKGSTGRQRHTSSDTVYTPHTPCSLPTSRRNISHGSGASCTWLPHAILDYDDPKSRTQRRTKARARVTSTMFQHICQEGNRESTLTKRSEISRQGRRMVVCQREWHEEVARQGQLSAPADLVHL